MDIEKLIANAQKQVARKRESSHKRAVAIAIKSARISADEYRHLPLLHLVKYGYPPCRLVRRVQSVRDVLAGKGLSLGTHTVGIFGGIAPHRLAIVLYADPSGRMNSTHAVHVITYRHGVPPLIELNFNDVLFRTAYTGHESKDVDPDGNGAFLTWIKERLFPMIASRLEITADGRDA